jgi:hypothetical protein
VRGCEQEADIQVTRNSIETRQGPGDWFSGVVYFDSVAAPSNGSRLSASSVHFTPGRFMTHIAMLKVDENGNPATWGDHVTNEEYAAAPPVDN